MTIDAQSAVWINGAVVGTYVDNEAPQQASEVANAEGLRLAGISPYSPLPKFSGAIRLRQFYPWTLRERPRKGEGYILPATFHWPERPPYTMGWRRHMWCIVKRLHPVMVVWYGWNERVGPKVQALMRRPCET